MNRPELILRTRQLIAEGERLDVEPSLGALQLWLQLSDDLLARAWGSMDRYHLAWLMVGKPKGIIRGRPMTPDEEAAYVREVASQKTAALRMSLDAVERQGMPFVGETGGVGAAGRSGAAAGGGAAGSGGATGGGAAAAGPAGATSDQGADRASGSEGPAPAVDRAPDRAGLPTDPSLAERLEAARREADAHRDHGERRAPRPDRMQR
jgi:hypothetical protein